jgi:small subunit ribosomal protein S2
VAAAEEGGEMVGESTQGEEVDLEAALGGGIRKAPAGVVALAEEDEAAEGGY